MSGTSIIAPFSMPLKAFGSLLYEVLFICDLSVLTFGRVHFFWVEQIIYS